MLSLAFDMTFAERNQAGTGRYARALVAALRERPEIQLREVGAVRRGLPHTVRWLLSGARDELRSRPASLFHSPALVAPWNLPIPFVLTAHDAAPRRFPADHPLEWRAYDRFVSPRRARAAARVIAVSDFSREQVVDAYGLDPSRVVTVYSGVESRFLEVPPRGEPAPERPRLLFAGAPIGRKNIDVVLRAMAAAQRGSALSAAVLEIAGAQRHDFPRVSALVDQLGLSERVTWLGVVPEEGLPAAFATADVLVYPSLYEGFGFPPLEAMATGTAVVAARAGSLPEVLGDAALLADPTSAEEWRESLEAVLGDRELRRRLERAGTERARRFTWQACAEKTLAVYREAVAESGIAAAR